jgi:hypothetical protein
VTDDYNDSFINTFLSLILLGMVRLESGTFKNQAATMDKTIIMDIVHLLEFFKHNFSYTGSLSVIRCKGGNSSTQLGPSDLVSEETQDDRQYPKP